MSARLIVLVTILVFIALVSLCSVLWLVYIVRQTAKAHNALAERLMLLESRVFSEIFPDEKLMESFRDSFLDDPDHPKHSDRKSDS